MKSGALKVTNVRIPCASSDAGDVRVMDFGTTNGMFDQQSSPNPCDEFIVRYQSQCLFDEAQTIIDFKHSEAESVTFDRSCPYVPKFAEILRCET